MTLAEFVLTEFDNKNLNFDLQPLYPAVLVRVLPKETISRSGLIYLPDEKVNKPIFEGIVLRTWKDKTVHVKDKPYRMTCPVSAGDHILFPHWSGEAVPMLPDSTNRLSFEEYRLIPAKDLFSNTGSRDAGEILGTLQSAKEGATTLIHSILIDVRLGMVNVPEALDKLKENFELMRKIKEPITTSGV
jgi:co-chaperonin GroES (HSP10)